MIVAVTPHGPTFESLRRPTIAGLQASSPMAMSPARLQRQMAHLRARLRELDLAVRRVRRRGYLLQPR